MAGLRLGLIGCGGMAHGHLRAYQAIREKEPTLFELAAVCDVDLTRAQAFATEAAAWQEGSPRVYATPEEMLAAESLDAADICAPHFEHHRVGLLCLEHGVPIEVEKPIGITVKASWRLIEAAQRAGLVLATAENIRRQPGPRTARWLLQERRVLGEPRLFVSQRSQYQAPKAGAAWVWRADRLLGGGGPVLDSGAHFCDTVRYLFGDVDRVYAEVRHQQVRPVQKDGQSVPDQREDMLAVTLTFSSGLVGLWMLSTGLPGHDWNEVAYYGTGGALVDPGDVFHGPRLSAVLRRPAQPDQTLEELYPEYLASLDAQVRARLFPHGLTNGVALEVYEFLDAIRGRRAPEVDGIVGLKAKSVAWAIYESAACGRAVRVADVEAGRVDAAQREINWRWGI